MNNIPAVLSFVLMGAFGLYGIRTSNPATVTWAGAFATSRVVAPTGGAPVIAPRWEIQTVRLRVEGMTCGGCAISARVVLQRLDGVHKAEVSYRDQVAVVTYDGEKVTPERMIEALNEKLRYVATVVDAASAA